MSTQPSKLMLVLAVTIVCTFGMENHLLAQRGVRIGNFFRAGGGQGFQLGGPRAGMHFGGGQGATIGTQNYGMRFGNGQGVRIGGPNYGMQFGGGQGTQIGRFRSAPAVAPGSYYYGNAQPYQTQRVIYPQHNSADNVNRFAYGQPVPQSNVLPNNIVSRPNPAPIRASRIPTAQVPSEVVPAQASLNLNPAENPATTTTGSTNKPTEPAVSETLRPETAKESFETFLNPPSDAPTRESRISVLKKPSNPANSNSIQEKK